ncbi:MAG: FAD-binding oxidoreductase [Bacteroidetes bacterium]|nr:FAD-binding oxidoreductase [Bacteroidota bacterium]
MNKSVDHIVVGQGLAGSILALTLLERGRSVMVIDDGNPVTASKVAAGLYNPVVFKRLVKSWMADDLLPYMDSFYPRMETMLEQSFYFSKRILKPFAEEQEKTLWLKKTDEPVGKYLNREIYNDDLGGIVFNPLGISEVVHAGNLDTPKFLSATRNYLLKQDVILEEKFEHDLLVTNENTAHYKGIAARKIIFCEGHKTTLNPFFSWLPFKLTKGEIITIRLEKGYKIPDEIVLNKAVFILPLGNDTYKVGATYEWNDLSENITEKGRSELVEKLEKVLKISFEVIDHQAGIRPTVNDRRPLIGLHPDLDALGVFNGMGTKGVMLAPFFASQFADFLEGSAPLDKEVDIARFK